MAAERPGVCALTRFLKLREPTLYAAYFDVYFFRHVETDSPTYSWMNSQFFVLRVNGSAIPHFTFTMYEITN